MASQEELDLKNRRSVRRQRASRDRRQRIAEAKDRYRDAKQKMRESGFSSTKILRQLKKDRNDEIAEIKEGLTQNKLGSGDDIQNQSTDTNSSSYSTVDLKVCINGEDQEITFVVL